MDFLPIEGSPEGKSDICSDCGAEFILLGDNALVENLCVSCQVRMRIRASDRKHETNSFPPYINWWDKIKGMW